VVDPMVLTHRIDMSNRAPYRGRTRDRRTWERIAPEHPDQIVAA
jgi:hypothetical protein